MENTINREFKSGKAFERAGNGRPHISRRSRDSSIFRLSWICIQERYCAVVAATEVQCIKEHHWDELGMPETLWCNIVKEFGPLIVSIDFKGRNFFEEQKVVYNKRKEEEKKRIYPEVKFIK